MILYFETYSILQVIFLSLKISKARKILFHSKPFPPNKISTFKKKTLLKLINAINSDLSIEELKSSEEILANNWESNKEAVKLLNDYKQRILKTFVFKQIKTFLNDGNILKSFQLLFVNRISSKILFYSNIQPIIDSEKINFADLIVLPSEDILLIKEYLVKRFEAIVIQVPKQIVILNEIRRIFFSYVSCIIYLISPLVYLLKNLGKFGKVVQKINADLAMQIIWGIKSEDKSVEQQIKSFRSDDYFYNGNILQGDIVHIYDSWKLEPEMKLRTELFLKEHGMYYSDAQTWKLNFSVLVKILQMQIKLFFSLYYLFISFRIDHYIFVHGYIIVHKVFDQLKEIENLDYRVYFRRDDYSIKHIICKIICNKYNRKVVGTHHAATYWDVPALAFVHFDDYLIYCKIHEVMMKDYWSELKLHRTGRENIDWVNEIVSDNVKLSKLKNKFESQYGRRENIILFIYPSADYDFNITARWDEMFDAISEILETSIDGSIVLRFRSVKQFEEVPFMKRFKLLEKKDKRIIIDFNSFSTQELMSIADVIIAHSASFAIHEALATRAKVFTYDFIGITQYYFQGYGKDFILCCKDDVIRTVKAIYDKFSSCDVNWEKLREDTNFYYDGKNLERMRDAVLTIITETKINSGI